MLHPVIYVFAIFDVFVILLDRNFHVACDDDVGGTLFLQADYAVSYVAVADGGCDVACHVYI